MKYSTPSVVAALAATAVAAPSTPTTGNQPRQAAAACASAVTLDAKTNVFSNYTLHPNSFYRNEVTAAVGNLTDKSLATAAAKLADVGTFLWL